MWSLASKASPVKTLHNFQDLDESVKVNTFTLSSPASFCQSRAAPFVLLVLLISSWGFLDAVCVSSGLVTDNESFSDHHQIFFLLLPISWESRCNINQTSFQNMNSQILTPPQILKLSMISDMGFVRAWFRLWKTSWKHLVTPDQLVQFRS
jgi:hypothetical protein